VQILIIVAINLVKFSSSGELQTLIGWGWTLILMT